MSALFEVDSCATSLTHFHNSDGMLFLSELKKFSNTHSRIMCIKGGCILIISSQGLEKCCTNLI